MNNMDHLNKTTTVKLRKKLIGSPCPVWFQENPLKIVRAEGQYMYDEENNKYLDCINNVCHVGHSHPDVTKAVSSQIGLLNTNTRFLHDGMLHMAKRLTDSLPGKLSVCFFCNSGSEANDLALRLARKYTGNKDVLILDDAYHGHTDLLIDISPHKYKKPCMEGKKDWVHVMRTRSKVPRTTDPLDWVEKKQDPPGTVVRFVSHEIGKGVFAEKNFNKGEFLFEYDGQLKPADDTVEDDQTFIFNFKCDGKNLCIDATASKRNGRFANDEWRNPNAYVKKASFLEVPKLLIFARRKIITGEEIRFDYGQKDATWRYKVASGGIATSNEGSQNLIDQSGVQSALPEHKEEEEEYVPDLPQEEDEEDAASMYIPDIYRGEYAGDQNAGEKYALMLKNTIDKATQDGRKISAFILEAMQSCGGQQVYPAGYMRHCFKYVRDAGALCIVDEVQTGFGRVGSKMWAFQLQGDDIEPDIISFGKPMGNGFPVAAVVTTPEIATKFGEGGHEYFNTYGGNPVAAAAALAVWDILEKENLREHATVVGEFLLNEMTKLQSKLEILGHVRGVGLFQGYELVRDRETKEPATEEATEAITRCREKFNILLSTEGPHNNVLKFKPPMCFSKDDAKYLVKCLSEVLSEIERNSKEQNGK